jgi:CubicO group peptidase (beta-lactamase class C family)
VSKTFTWTAVMMLVERGLIDLDADVNSYLKSVRIAEAFGAPVTMRHLMHHRAGFEDSLRVFAVGDDDPRSLAQLLSEHQPARVYAPGQRTSYSNWGSALAAQIVADVSGLDYAAFLQREILDPLGMRATTFIAPSKLDAQTRAALATGYKAQQGALGVQNYMQLGAYWPAGGLACTASDMARWMRFHLNGGELDGVRLMRAETHRSMWTRGYDDRPAGADLAHGFQDRSYRGLRLLGHGGATAAFFTNMVLVPELSLGIFVSQSSQQTRLSVSQLPELLIDQLADRHYAPALAAEPGAAAAMAEFAGTYVPNRRVFSSFAAVLGLVNTLRVSAIADGTLLVAGGGQAHQYRRLESDRDTFESAEGARLAFVREGQAVVALADGSGVHSFEKAHGLNHPTTITGALAVATLLALTTLLGFWWRLGRGTDYGQGLAAGVAASASILGALAMLGLVATLAMLAQVSMDVSAMPGSYPPPSMRYVHYAAWAVAGVAGFGLLALWPAWRADGWGFWRRTHFSLFALTLALLAYQLWQWRLFGAPVY